MSAYMKQLSEDSLTLEELNVGVNSLGTWRTQCRAGGTKHLEQAMLAALGNKVSTYEGELDAGQLSTLEALKQLETAAGKAQKFSGSAVAGRFRECSCNCAPCPPVPRSGLQGSFPQAVYGCG